MMNVPVSRWLDVGFAWLILVSPLAAQQRDTSRAGNEQVAEIIRTFPGRGVMADGSQPTPADEAVRQFRVRDGFEIELVAAEPEIEQPLFLSWDSRGRLWVVHYRQYQYPAGLKVIRYDQHLRAVFDKVPDPPPRGTPGGDRITVHEDTDGDGRYDVGKEVISGLNIATSVAVGNGSIWVLNPPYLLRYPDADRNDVPDGDPEVHLRGFGLQDTHSVANSLMFGPDGWLYGSNGSTTVGDVSSEVTKGVRFQGQCVWRYHPQTKVFEIYAEGGGNTFSLEIDSVGRVFAGHNGGNTRGWYFPQGSYSAKNWGKHGPLTNPFALGFFREMRFQGDPRRFPQAFCIYEGGLFPASFAGTIIAPNSLHNLVWHSDRIADGSTFRTEDRENLLESPDRWFRPVYAGVGPDGAVYLADWYDSRLSHVSPVDDWHKTSGRIYRVFPAGTQPSFGLGDLHTLASEALIAHLGHPNRWIRQRAALELGWRGDPEVTARLIKLVEQGSLEALWALNLRGEVSSDRAARWLNHDNPHLRRWVVRLLGDRGEGLAGLAELAVRERDVEVRSQLAATAKRIPSPVAVPLIRGLLSHDEDATDPHLPLMVWWALEAHADDWRRMESFLADPQVWSLPMFRQHMTARLMQRYAAASISASAPQNRIGEAAVRSGDDDRDSRGEAPRTSLQRCAVLLSLAPDDATRDQLLVGLFQAFQGRALPALPVELEAALDDYRAKLGKEGVVLGVRQRDAEAIKRATALLSDSAAEVVLRSELAVALGDIAAPAAVPPLIALATGRDTDEPALQRVAILALGNYADPEIADALVGSFGSRISDEHGLRATACRVLASRPAWASALLRELNQWRLRPDQVPTDVIQQLRTYDDPSLAAEVTRAFGQPISASGAEQVAEIHRLKQILGAAPGDAGAGQRHFVQRCASCHQLFGEGDKVGPALDGYQRDDVNFWLTAVVAPSLEIREGFQSYLALTVDGRAINGMIADQDDHAVTIRSADKELSVLPRDEIESLAALPTSLMPADTLKDLRDQEIRDLLAYLMWQAR